MKNRAVVVILFLGLLIGNISTRNADSYAACSDILLVFARGSSQGFPDPKNPDRDELIEVQPEAAKFFNALDSRIASWISKEKINLANFEGKYDPNGYTAASAFNFDSITEGDVPNALQEKLGVEGNEYITSVNSGVAELTGFLTERASQCPKQEIVLGGYSQGAHVIGETLKNLDNNTLVRINFAAMFGDPKLNIGFDVKDYKGALIDTSARTIDDILDSTQFGDVLDQPEAPWVRGDINWKVTGGGLGARMPYVPDVMSGRVGSWCDAQDAICNGDLEKIIDTQIGHTSYPDRWMDQAANEIAEHLNTAFPFYAGAIKTAKWEPHYSEDGVTDVMIVIDTTGSMATIIAQAKANATSIVNRIFDTNQHKNPRVGLVQFRDQGSTFLATTDVQLTDDKDSLINAISNLQTGDGGDDPEAWYSGIMEGYNQPWREGARKVMYFIADTQPKDPEPVTGLTARDVTQRALEIDPVQIYPIWLNGFVATQFQQKYQEAANKLALETGGRLIKTPDKYQGKFINGNITKGLEYATTELATDPVAQIDGPDSGLVGEALLFNGGKTYDAEKAIVEYSWDFDNDHIIDVVSDSPRVVWRYDQAYTGFVTMFVKASDGGVSSATKNIKIDALSVEEEPVPVEEDIPEVEEPEVVSEPEVTVIDEPSINTNSGTSGTTNTSNDGNNTNSNQTAQGVVRDLDNNFSAILGEETGQNTKKKEVRGAVDNFDPKFLASLPNVEQTQSKNKILIGLLAVALLFIVTSGVFVRRKLRKS
ncbi:MAG TPA: cutinase family protein [Candidatus Saccharibacteria bacterium]|nr:cutinase family protein [Candidatus Saccharibacteria bacterium]